jgi:formyltetrahydrofolate-dependent phosphoribosylglycinamide formyltransferase
MTSRATSPAPADVAPRVTARVAVLASGGGSNLQALLDHAERAGGAGTSRAAAVVLVASNQPASGALERARARGSAAEVLADPGDARAMADLLDRHAVDLVVLAGYLKLVPPEVVRRFPGRMLNVHPALLPAFGGHGMYGRRVHEAVIRSGARVSGVTVHFVDEEYDRGPIVAQWPVPVLSGDDAASLAARVLRAEHLLYPRAVEAVAAGTIRLEGDRVIHDPMAAGEMVPVDVAFALATDAAHAAGSVARLLTY